MRVREIRQRPHVVAEPVQVRHPRNRDQPRPPIHQPFKVAHVDGAVPVPHDPQLDAFCLLQPPVNDGRTRIHQIVDDDVVSGLEFQRVDDDVLAFGGGEEQADLIRGRVDQAAKAAARFVGLVQHVADFEWPVRARIEPGAPGLDDRPRDEPDVCGVQEGVLGDRREIAPNAQRIVAGLRRRRRLARHRCQSGRAGRSAEEPPSGHIHWMLLLYRRQTALPGEPERQLRLTRQAALRGDAAEARIANARLRTTGEPQLVERVQHLDAQLP